PERLRLRVHAQALAAGALPPRGVARMRADMVRQGHYFDGGPPALVARDTSVAPMLAWDGNINGGVLQDRFVFNGLTFEAAPDVRAKSGLVAGASAAGVMRHAWQTGRLIEIRGAAEIGWSPRHRIGRADAMASVCLQNHLRGWSFLDLCGTAARYWRELDRGTAYQRSAGIVQVLAAENSAHQLEVRASRVSGSGQDQTRLALSAESVWNRLASRAELTLGQPRDDATLLHHRLDGGVTWLMGDRPVSLDLQTQVLEGGAFLGVPRRDRVWGLSLSTRLRPGASLRVGVIDSRSTAGIANYRQVTLDLRLDRLR
ncbi:hypothetical protein, partial [Paracoccus liaowanqingii]|uniref:hypothetical protein n=1 Tax=Paracoccus liaowanqingii TaxID=2560053 RepID=UPI00143D39A3